MASVATSSPMSAWRCSYVHPYASAPDLLGVALKAFPIFDGPSWAGVRALELGLARVSVQIGFSRQRSKNSLTCPMVSSFTGAAPWLVMAATALPMTPSRMCDMIVSASWAGLLSLWVAASPPRLFVLGSLSPGFPGSFLGFLFLTSKETKWPYVEA